jgi:hypothetical protein
MLPPYQGILALGSLSAFYMLAYIKLFHNIKVKYCRSPSAFYMLGYIKIFHNIKVKYCRIIMYTRKLVRTYENEMLIMTLELFPVGTKPIS